MYVYRSSFGSFNPPFDHVDCFEPKLHVWLTGPPLPTAVEEAGAVTVNGVLYVLGGRVSYGGVTGVVYIVEVTLMLPRS